MYSTTLNGKRLLYGAEMDGIESVDSVDLESVDLNKCKFVEVKVKLREQHDKQKQNFLRFKLRNWWCQSFLVNIQKIVFGTRNNAGIVTDLSTLSVKDIPKQVRVRHIFQHFLVFCEKFHVIRRKIMSGKIFFFIFQNYWSPAVCMQFCDDFLQYVIRVMDKVDNPSTVYRFDYDPQRSPNIQMQRFEQPSELRFLPQWYIEQIEKLSLAS